MDPKQTWSESYASFDDVPEWIADDNGREPATVSGASAGETIELTVTPDRFAAARDTVREYQSRQQEL